MQLHCGHGKLTEDKKDTNYKPKTSYYVITNK